MVNCRCLSCKFIHFFVTVFQVWTEQTSGRGAVNFITGMGGFLQSILFGFGGLRLSGSHLLVNPVLPPSCTDIHITGLGYRGNSLSIDVDQSMMTFTLTSRDEGGHRKLRVSVGKESVTLELNRPETFAREKATIEVVDGR